MKNDKVKIEQIRMDFPVTPVVQRYVYLYPELTLRVAGTPGHSCGAWRNFAYPELLTWCIRPGTGRISDKTRF